MPRYKLAIFDFDGTLFDTRKAIVYSIEQTFDARNQTAPSQKVIAQSVSCGMGLEDTLKLLLSHQNLQSDELSDWLDTYRHIYQTQGVGQVRPFGDIQRLLSHFKKWGLQIAIVSNKGTAAIEKTLAIYHLNEYIALVVGDSSGVEKKPHPMSFERFIRPYFGDEIAKKAVVIGDTAVDIKYAHNIGAHACWAKYGYGNSQECAAL